MISKHQQAIVKRTIASNKMLRQLERLKSPRAIQDFLDSIAYRNESEYCSPLDVVRDKKANCFDGALFAALALRRLGYAPLLLDLRAVRDDDHVLAVFKSKGLWGAIAKSNYVGLRYRDPVYRTLRELAMSYFEFYFNTKGEKTLREFSRPLSLSKFDRYSWATSRTKLPDIALALDEVPHSDLLPKGAKNCTAMVDARSLRAGLLGSDPKGLYLA